MEEWKAIQGFEGYYEVSNRGRIRSVDRVQVYSDGRRCHLKGKILAFGTSGKNNYAQVNCKRPGLTKVVRVHVAVAAAFLGPAPDGTFVLHKDGNPRNCVVHNLYYGTRAQNTSDAYDHGALACGAGHRASKLTEKDVQAIRASISEGKTQRELADEYGVARTTISALVTERSWKRLPG